MQFLATRIHKTTKQGLQIISCRYEIFGKVENGKDYLYLNTSRPSTGQREKNKRGREGLKKKSLEMKVIEAKEYHQCKGSAARITINYRKIRSNTKPN